VMRARIKALPAGQLALVSLSLLGGAFSPAASAAEPAQRAVYRVERTEEAIQIDGRLDEGVWQREPSFRLEFETRPAENQPPPVQTEVWITYDVNNLYVAFRAHDPDPRQIRARYSDRDKAFSDDFVGIVLDTFDDERRGFEFFSNPLGVQMDLTQNEMTGNEDDSWDAIWDSAGRITDEGYVVELRIPFSSLRFPPSDGEMTWGLHAHRSYPRDKEHSIAVVPLDRDDTCYLCQEAKLTGLAGIEPARSIELDPTLTASRTFSRPDPDGPLEEDDTSAEPGLTAHWGITPNLTFTGTLNPDFSQVEADVAQLDVNTQFALFYPEKRPFFLEGADIFDTRFQAIYSRNIADPEWGAKLTGKQGKNALGVIVAQDQTTNFLIPSSQGSSLSQLDEENVSTIVRYRRDLFGTTTGGFFYTGREGDGFHNRVVGGDVLFRWDETEAARIEILGSQTQYPEEIAADNDQSAEEISDFAIRAVYQHTSRDWVYYVLYREVGEDFRADLGFVPRSDYREGSAALERAWYPNAEGWSQVRVRVEVDEFRDHEGRSLESRNEALVWAQGPKQSYVQLSLIDGDQLFEGKTFNTDRIYAFAEAQLSKSLYASVEVNAGNQVDFANGRQGEQLRIDPALRLDLGKHLRVNVDHSREELDIDEGRLFTAALTQLRATYQFNVRTFVRVVSQYLDIEREAGLYLSEVDPESQSLFNQLLFSYKVNPQTVLFLGYSDSYLGDQSIDLRQEGRTLFFKMGYAWLR
jgi:Domain of unknown function (DUF5916)/Carbohydrate family 9 binding domain-like